MHFSIKLAALGLLAFNDIASALPADTPPSYGDTTKVPDGYGSITTPPGYQTTTKPPDYGCTNGGSGKDCTTSCTNGGWGPDCTTKGHCTNGGSGPDCTTKGHCTNGGSGPDCTTSCENGGSGPGCSTTGRPQCNGGSGPGCSTTCRNGGSGPDCTTGGTTSCSVSTFTSSSSVVTTATITKGITSWIPITTTRCSTGSTVATYPTTVSRPFSEDMQLARCLRSPNQQSSCLRPLRKL